MGDIQDTRRRTIAIFFGLVVLPICAVPLYLAGQHTADSLDNNDSNGVLALGLFVGVGVPALAAVWVARSSGAWKWLPSLALGIVSGFLSVVALLAALFLFYPGAGS